MRQQITLMAAACVALFFAGPVTATQINLGSAGDYALLGVGAYGGVSLAGNSHIDGNIGAAQSYTANGHTTITGHIDYGNSYQASGNGSHHGAQQQSSSFWDQVRSDLWSASNAAAALTADVTLGNTIAGDYTFNSQGALTVFDIAGVNLSGTNELTLNGQAGDQFIINVNGEFSLNGSTSITLAGGVAAEDVLFNLHGNNLSASGNSVLTGTFMSAGGILDFSGNQDMARFLGDQVSCSGHCSAGGLGNSSYGPSAPTVVPEPASLPLLAFGLLLGWIGLVRRQSTREHPKMIQYSVL